MKIEEIEQALKFVGAKIVNITDYIFVAELAGRQTQFEKRYWGIGTAWMVGKRVYGTTKWSHHLKDAWVLRHRLGVYVLCVPHTDLAGCCWQLHVEPDWSIPHRPEVSVEVWLNPGESLGMAIPHGVDVLTLESDHPEIVQIYYAMVVANFEQNAKELATLERMFFDRILDQFPERFEKFHMEISK